MSRNELATGASDPVERTVQLAGNSTYVVSLPKEWAVEQGLESGMSMYLYPQDDRLVAATETVSARDRTATIDAAELSGDGLRRRIEGAYLLGCDRIAVEGLGEADPQVRRTLERTVGRLVGITIREDDGEALTVANVLDDSEVSLSQTIAQLRNLVVEMQTDAIVAVLTDDDALARQVIARDDDVDRLFAFVGRGFHRGLADVTELDRLGTTRIDAFRDYRIARELERVADHAEAIARVATRQDGPPADPFGERLEAAGSDARAVVEAALAGETDRARETAAAARERLEGVERVGGASESDAVDHGMVVHHVRRTVANGCTIADVALESSLADASAADPAENRSA